MSFNDYVKFVTQQVVSYVDQPKEKRKQLKQQKKEQREPMQTQLFGMIPLAISMFVQKNHPKHKYIKKEGDN